MVRKYILIVAIGLLCGNIIQSVPATVTESRNIVVELLTLLNRLEKVPEDHKDILRKIRSEPPTKQIELYKQVIVQLQDVQQAVKNIQQEILALKRTHSTMIRNYLQFVQQQKDAINEHIRAAKQSAQTEEAAEHEAEGKSRGLIARFTYFIKQKIAQWKGVDSSLQELDSVSYALISSYMRQLKRWDFVLGALAGNAASSGSADALSVAYDDLDARITAIQSLIQEAERMDAQVQKLKEKPVITVSVIPPRKKVMPKTPAVHLMPKKPRKKRTKIDVWKKIVEIPLNKPGVLVTTARLSPDGKKLVILSKDGKCELYSVPTGKWLYTLGSEGETFAAVDFVNDNTLIASERTRVDYEFKEQISIFVCEVNTCEKFIIASTALRVKQALYNRGSQQLLILTDGKELYSLDTTAKNPEINIASGVSHMAIDCTSGYSATVSYDVKKDEYTVAIRDAQNSLVKEIVSNEMITALAINMHTKKIATATNNSDAIKLWNFETGQVSKTLENYAWQHDDAGKEIRVAIGHTETIESLDFNKDGTLLLSASHDQTARAWNLTTGTSQVIQESKGSLMRYVQFNCTRDTALIVNQYAVSVWNRGASPAK